MRVAEMRQQLIAQPRQPVFVRDHQCGNLAANDPVYQCGELGALEVQPASDLGNPLINRESFDDTELFQGCLLMSSVWLLRLTGHPQGGHRDPLLFGCPIEHVVQLLLSVKPPIARRASGWLKLTFAIPPLERLDRHPR